MGNVKMPVFDAHCHIYPDKIAPRAIEGIKDFYDLSTDTLDGTVEGLIESGKKAGITGFLVHSVSTTPSQVRSINEFLAGEVNKHKDKFIGFGTLHPDSETIDEDIEHLIKLGLKGVKLHPDFQKFGLDTKKAIDLCSKLSGRLPVLVHCGDSRYNFSNPPQMRKFLDELPDLTVIGAHFGGWGVTKEAYELLAGTPNLYVDSSSTFYLIDKEESKRYIYGFGCDRILFGTDYPMWRPEPDLERIREIGLNEDEERMILYENAKKLFGLEE